MWTLTQVWASGRLVPHAHLPTKIIDHYVRTDPEWSVIVDLPELVIFAASASKDDPLLLIYTKET